MNWYIRAVSVKHTYRYAHRYTHDTDKFIDASTEEGQATISALAERLAAAFSDPNAGASAAQRFQATAETYAIASMDDDELEHALAWVTNLWNTPSRGLPTSGTGR